MVSPSHLKSLQQLQALSVKPSSSSSYSSPSTTLTFMKIKTLIQTFIFSHVCRLIRTLEKAKSIFIEFLKDNIHSVHFILPSKTSKLNKHKKKIFFGSFRLHYNWCSSHVAPVPAPVLDEATYFHYDLTWNSMIPIEQSDHERESELSEYLIWLEQKVHDNNSNNNASTEQKMNEIDRLADLFIAKCHEKFRLEKQESYRRFQEMLARSM
ncbi:uncharacterized protein LOC123216650 [Mangifera indica]|uniref:uncharacterized protein LOC123216650 n=1 Tax=Mangifera indica TaxID=29780 RepID=UPI001CF9E4BC|nr:uncharacterized protein LOC123216650 [Mangifera indica]